MSEPIPMLETNREDFTLTPEQIILCKYLLFYKGKTNLSQIVDEALQEFLAVEFETIGVIEHFRDEVYEEKIEQLKIKQELQAKENYEARLLQRAKKSIIEKEIELIRKQDTTEGNNGRTE